MQDSTAFSFGDNRLPVRFWDKLRVNQATGCWEWMAARKPAGYGGWWYKGKQSSTHRDAYTELVGPIPPGLYLDHICRNRPCCNPAHLRTVSPRVNSIENSVSPPAINYAKTHCDNGHPYPDVPLTEAGKSGHRFRRCGECRRQKNSRPKAVTTHGTPAGYRAGCRCEACVEHQRLRMRDYRHRKALTRSSQS